MAGNNVISKLSFSVFLLLLAELCMCKSDIESLYLMKRNAFKLIAVAALVFGLAAMTSCGGRGNKSGKTAENDGGQVAEAVEK